MLMLQFQMTVQFCKKYVVKNTEYQASYPLTENWYLLKQRLVSIG